MATIGDLTNVRVCGAGNVLGANNSKGCPFDFQDIKMVGVISPSAKFASTDVFNEQAIKDLQAAGKLEIFQGVDGVELTGNDDTINSSNSGVDRKSVKGLYKIKLTFLEDLFFQSAVTSFDGFKNWYTFLVDSAGNMLFTKKTNGDMYGFTTGMLSAGMYSFGSTENTAVTLEFQWTNRDDLDKNFAFIDNNSLDFNPLDLEGVVQSNISLVTVPANLDTTLTVKASYARGGDSIPTLTTVNDWKVLLNGNGFTLTSATYNESTEEYTLSFLFIQGATFVTGDVLEIGLNGIVDVSGDCLYKGNTIKKVTVV